MARFINLTFPITWISRIDKILVGIFSPIFQPDLRRFGIDLLDSNSHLYIWELVIILLYLYFRIPYWHQWRFDNTILFFNRQNGDGQMGIVGKWLGNSIGIWSNSDNIIILGQRKGKSKYTVDFHILILILVINRYSYNGYQGKYK